LLEHYLANYTTTGQRRKPKPKPKPRAQFWIDNFKHDNLKYGRTIKYLYRMYDRSML
jgi:hypothetical protein